VLLVAACGGGGVSSHLKRGEKAMESGDWEEARLEGIYILQQQPENAQALWLVGRSLLALDRDGESEGYMNSLLERDPSFRPRASELFALRAQRDYLSDRKRRAADRWERCLDFDPEFDLGPYSFFEGRHFFSEEDYASAARLFERAEKAFPDSSAVIDILLPFAKSLTRLGRWEDASRHLGKFLKRAPRHPKRQEAIFLYQDVLIRLARADRELLDFDSALKKLDQALRFRSNPGKIEEARLEKGLCLESLGRYPEAAQVYRRLVKANISGTGRSLETALDRLDKIEKARLK